MMYTSKHACVFHVQCVGLSTEQIEVIMVCTQHYISVFAIFIVPLMTSSFLLYL